MHGFLFGNFFHVKLNELSSEVQGENTEVIDLMSSVDTLKAQVGLQKTQREARPEPFFFKRLLD